MNCIKCGIGDVKLFEIMSENGTYNCCMLCLGVGLQTLRKNENKTFEDKQFMSQITGLMGNSVFSE